MAGELATSRRSGSSARRVELERKHVEVEERRRYIETILERIATGVVSVDAGGRDHARSTRAAARLLERRSRRSSASRSTTVFDRDGPAAARRAARSAPAGRGEARRAGDRARRATGASCTSPPSRRALPGDDGAPRRHRAGARRRDAADPRAEGRGVARGRAPAGARDQESADADSAVGRAAAAALRRRAAGDPRAGRRVHDDDRRRGRVAEGAGRRVLAVRADAGAAHGADRPARSSSTDTLALYNGLFSRRRASSGGSRPALPLGAARPEQIRRVIINLVDNAIEAMERARRGSSSRPQHDAGQQPRARSSSPTTARAFRPASARSCSCRTTRPSGAAAASAWRSCAASSPSTAAASKSATTCRAARGLRSSCPC